MLSFIQALSTDLIGKPGKNVGAVIDQAKRLLGADVSQLNGLDKQLSDSALQVLILAVGSEDGGIIHNANAQPRTDNNGRPGWRY